MPEAATIENPQIDQADDLQALEALIAAEESKDTSSSLKPGQQAGQTPSAEPATTAPKAEAPKPKSDIPATPKGAPATNANAETTTDADDDNDPNLSRYEKAKRREARAWKEINAAKAALKAEREAIEKARQPGATDTPTGAPAATAAPKYSAEQYERAAESFEAQGKFDLADAARAEAQKLRANPAAAPAPTPAAENGAQRQQFEAAQLKVWEETKTKFPELLDRGGDMHKAFTEFLGQHPDVLSYAQGPLLAAEFVAARLDAARVPGFREQVQGLQKRIAELEASLAPIPAGGKSAVPGEKSWEDMTTTEQAAALEREAAAASG